MDVPVPRWGGDTGSRRGLRCEGRVRRSRGSQGSQGLRDGEMERGTPEWRDPAQRQEDSRHRENVGREATEQPTPMTGAEEELVGGQVCGDSKALRGQDRATVGWGPLRQERPQRPGPAFCLEDGPA